MPNQIEHHSFNVWKDEALSKWTETWGAIYKGEKAGKKELESLKFLLECQNSLFLMSIIDNDYSNSTLVSILN